MGIDLTPGQAISGALSRAQDSRGGGKNLAEVFDGREGPVALSTISRWISDPKRFPSTGILVLARLDSAFRRQLQHALLLIDQEESPIIDELSPAARAEYEAAVERRLRLMVYGGGEEQPR